MVRGKKGASEEIEEEEEASYNAWFSRIAFKTALKTADRKVKMTL